MVRLGTDPMGAPMAVPAVVVKSEREGPVVGVTAAIHGNELNGIPVIHRLLRSESTRVLKRGTMVAVPVLNPPGFLSNRREFLDGKDLNRIMPGDALGNCSEVYAHRLLERVVAPFEYLLDLHTASFGRENSLYVRADMERPIIAEMARRTRPQIIVHNGSGDGTLRRAATEMDIHAITVEVGNPQRVQPGLVKSSKLGIQEVLEYLDMVEDLEDPVIEQTIECVRSAWMYTDEGGLLQVIPKLIERLKKNDLVARLYNTWGDLVREYHAPHDGVVVGLSTNPVAFPGSRILHLGVEGTVQPTKRAILNAVPA